MVKYKCDECKKVSEMSIDQPIRCKHCGGRVMHQVRSTNIIQYVAR